MSKRAQGVWWLVGIVPALAMLTTISLAADPVPAWVVGTTVAGVVAGIALEHRPPDPDGRRRVDRTHG